MKLFVIGTATTRRNKRCEEVLAGGLTLLLRLPNNSPPAGCRIDLWRFLMQSACGGFDLIEKKAMK